jgi:uncharacterized repeat protein (TIGR01451 family)
MSALTQRLGKGFLPIVSVISILSALGFDARVIADQAVDIPNTATANFRAVPAGPLTGVVSNPTLVPALIITPPVLEITKTADRATAEPGDTVIYRLLVRNTGDNPANNITVTDTLPVGLQFIPKTEKAGFVNGGVTTPLALTPAQVTGRVITFNYPGILGPSQGITLVYAALLTPDALRGTGRNLAVAQGTDRFNRTIVSNTASYQLKIRRGILSDCGTIIGRVFVDKNFDGEQQPGEPGVPNAVIFLDDGNRITTDANGLYSLNFVLPGTHTGTLDLTSLPGYTIAPNLYRMEKNSPSRMVQMAPGSTVKMNFAVTPTFGEGRK